MCRRPKKVTMGGLQHQRSSTNRTRFVSIFSFICCIISLVITFICLFSGNESSSMWDSPVLSVNTTLLGYDLFSTNSSNMSRIKALRTASDLSKSANPVTAEVNGSALRSTSTNTLADAQSAELGIQQWYSFNILSICEGEYYPSASVPDPKFEATLCISKTPMTAFNFTAHLQQELRNGNANATLSELYWPAELQRGLDAANGYLAAAFVLSMFSIIFLLSTIIPSAIMVFLTSTYSSLSPKILLLSAISFLLTITTAATMTTYSNKTTSLLTIGSPVSIIATGNRQFLLLSWTNVLITLLLTTIWAIEVILKCRDDRRKKIILHQEHYERARVWGKIGAMDGEEPMCSCVDPWKVMGHRSGGDCGGKGMAERKEVERDVDRGEADGGDVWVGVEEKVLVLGK